MPTRSWPVRHRARWSAIAAKQPAGVGARRQRDDGRAVRALSAEAGDHEQALATVRDALRFTPDNHPNLLYVEGLALTGLGRRSEAHQCFNRVLAADWPAGATRSERRPQRFQR